MMISWLLGVANQLIDDNWILAGPEHDETTHP